MEYNTTREHLRIKEYGRSVHNMIKYLKTIEDKEARQRNAESIIEIMATLNPSLKNSEDYKHKFWDHLFLIADYELDVQSPYPLPTKEQKQEKPKPLHYPKNKIKWNHFGKNFEVLFEHAMKEEDEEKRNGFIMVLALFMKVAYNNWHKENIHDDMIKDELLLMSKGKLVYEPGTRFSEWVDISESAIVPNMKKFFGDQLSKSQSRNKNNRYNNNNGGANRNNKFTRYKKKNSY
ncbi:MAG: DUF4290 domain-containing protein [Chitinophagaceae bacterium]